ncbi:LapA family protein [Pseudomonas sp. PWP3-1b2]|uniref:LapA family protein n=1 Tax=Pseudomonas sp. PWP3-1b2 TaxID=2804656 RepID=UPI003CEC2D64
MRGIKRVVAALTMLVVVLLVVGFVLENQQSVSLSFFGLSSAQMPISVFVVLALVVGMMIGPLLGVLFRTRRHRGLAAGHL